MVSRFNEHAPPQTFIATDILRQIRVPAVLLVALGIVTLLAFLGPIQLDGETLPDEIKWGLLAGWLLTAVGQYWSTGRLKQVEIDDEMLYVSNFVIEDTVALSDIGKVTQARGLNTEPVYVTFKRETDFGNRILFSPRGRNWRFWRAHPVVDELRRASQLARTKPGV